MKSIHLFRLGLYAVLFLVAVINYYWHLTSGWYLPKALYKKKVVVVGRIASLPRQTSLGTSFLLKLEKINGEPANAFIRLSGYLLPGSSAFFSAGDRWQFITHLKPAHSLHNFGAFDYARILTLQGIRATGYLVTQADNRCLLHDPTYFPMLRLRQIIQHKIETSLVHFSAEAAIISALTVGSTSSMNNNQWQVFRLTGTSHLVAISGLHIGLMAAIGLFLFKWMGRISPSIFLKIPITHLGIVGGLIFALIYSALAGFSWPTQRAVIMVFTLGVTQYLYHHIPLWRRLFLAWILILMCEPWGIFSASFNLSFCAVACLAYGLGGRWQAFSSLQQWWRMQWVIFVGLLPISLYYFKQVSLVMLVANFVAIPWVAWLVVPLSLLACFLFLFSTHWAHFVLLAAAYLLRWLWFFLSYLSQWSLAAWHHSLSQTSLLLLISVGALILMVPSGIPIRALGGLLLGLLVFYQPGKPSFGEWWLSCLDVGQGLAIVVQTKNHSLVYDTGVRYPGAFDAGRDVVIPFLEMKGIRDLDLLIISHGDNDHSGGAASLVSSVNIKQILTSIPSKFKGWTVNSCMAGQAWQWDGIDFRILSPAPGSSYQGNNSSCVLKISGSRSSALLTGDIQRATEHYLLEHYGDELASSVLVAPHHGSLSSSIEAFVQTVHAKIVLFATGFLNRYHFPNPKIVSLYRKYHAKLYSSARDGAVELKFKPDGQLIVNTAIKNEKHLEL